MKISATSVQLPNFSASHALHEFCHSNF